MIRGGRAADASPTRRRRLRLRPAMMDPQLDLAVLRKLAAEYRQRAASELKMAKTLNVIADGRLSLEQRQERVFQFDGISAFQVDVAVPPQIASPTTANDPIPDIRGGLAAYYKLTFCPAVRNGCIWADSGQAAFSSSSSESCQSAQKLSGRSCQERPGSFAPHLAHSRAARATLQASSIMRRPDLTSRS